MVCKKCKKEISEGFRFCPYCGHKTGNFTKPSFTNGDFLPVCSTETFSEEFEKLKIMEAKDAQSWLHNMHDPVTVYGMRVKYHYSLLDDKTKKPRYTDSREGFVEYGDIESLREELDGKSNCLHEFTEARVCERNLTKSRFRELGTTLFFTKDECERAVNEFRKEFFEKPDRVAI